MIDKLKWLARKLPFAITKNLKYDRQTRAVIKKCCSIDSNCIDVGCHKGEVLDVILGYAPNGTHYAFEPIPYLFDELKENYQHKNVAVYNLALSDTQSVTNFTLVPDNPEYSGLRRRKYDKEDEKVELIETKTDLLDNIVSGNTKIDFIKIDVEGAELQVLTGAKETIKRSKPVIVFEHGLGASDYYGTTPNDIHNLLVDQCGMKISLMERWLKNKNALTKAEFLDQYNSGLNFYYIAYY